MGEQPGAWLFMDLLPALAVVAGSYAASMLAFRRLRLLRARRAGLELSRFRVFDHGSLLEELRLAGGTALAERLVAHDAVRAAELAPGPGAAAATARALSLLAAAGASRDDAPPALAALLSHTRVLGMTFLSLELDEVRTGRLLSRALARAPAEPTLHLARAHLAAALGDGEAAADALARAVYYSRGAPYYARLVAGSEWLAVHRPVLVAEARARLLSEGPGLEGIQRLVAAGEDGAGSAD